LEEVSQGKGGNRKLLFDVDKSEEYFRQHQGRDASENEAMSFWMENALAKYRDILCDETGMSQEDTDAAFPVSEFEELDGRALRAIFGVTAGPSLFLDGLLRGKARERIYVDARKGKRLEGLSLKDYRQILEERFGSAVDTKTQTQAKQRKATFGSLFAHPKPKANATPAEKWFQLEKWMNAFLDKSNDLATESWLMAPQVRAALFAAHVPYVGDHLSAWLDQQREADASEKQPVGDEWQFRLPTASALAKVVQEHKSVWSSSLSPSVLSDWQEVFVFGPSEAERRKKQRRAPESIGAITGEHTRKGQTKTGASKTGSGKSDTRKGRPGGAGEKPVFLGDVRYGLSDHTRCRKCLRIGHYLRDCTSNLTEEDQKAIYEKACQDPKMGVRRMKDRKVPQSAQK
jgi:hypothetical protein